MKTQNELTEMWFDILFDNENEVVQKKRFQNHHSIETLFVNGVKVAEKIVGHTGTKFLFHTNK